MYKLLLVTDRPDIRENCEAFDEWESYGFRRPRVAEDAAGAADCLTRHHVDGIGVALPPEKDRELLTMLNELHPLIPVMDADTGHAGIRRNLSELDQLLTQLRADYSNDTITEAAMMQLCRHSFFRRVLVGGVSDPKEIRRELRMLRSRMEPGRGTVVIRLDFPDDDGYLDAHWRMGRDRLEGAMRNIFGAEVSGMRILASLTNKQCVWLVGCPMTGCEAPAALPEMMKVLADHARSGIAHVHEFLNITMSLTERYSFATIEDIAGLARDYTEAAS